MAIIRLAQRESPHTSYFAFGAPRDPMEAASPIIEALAYYLDYGDQSASTISIHVPPNSRVLQCRIEIQEAWAGISTMNVGDGSDPNGWLDTGAITSGTIGLYGDYDAVYPAAGGKLYQSGDTIDVVVTGVATTGKAILYVEKYSYHEAIATEE